MQIVVARVTVKYHVTAIYGVCAYKCTWLLWTQWYLNALCINIHKKRIKILSYLVPGYFLTESAQAGCIWESVVSNLYITDFHSLITQKKNPHPNKKPKTPIPLPPKKTPQNKIEKKPKQHKKKKKTRKPPKQNIKSASSF